jgi:cell division protein FtsL
MDFEGIKRVEEQTVIQRIWQSYGRILLTLCIAALVVHDVFGTHGYLALRRTKEEITKVQSDLARLNKENAKLQEEVIDLRTNPEKIEQLARDGLGLARPGERIIKMPQPQSQQADKNSK